MSNFIDISEKRQAIIYLVIFLWIIFGISASIFGVSYSSLAVYFLSLTGFVSSYIWSESIRKSQNTPIFKTGATSSREKMMYVTILLWVILGAWGIYKQDDFINLAAYFGALTPFVGAYIIGRTYKPNNDDRHHSSNSNFNDSTLTVSEETNNIPIVTGKPKDEIG